MSARINSMSGKPQGTESLLCVRDALNPKGIRLGE